MSGWQAKVPPEYEVANAIGAALARTTCQVTVLADTGLGYVSAPEEGYRATIGKQTGREEIVRLAFDLLRKKALRLGAREEDLEMELLEDHSYNMVRGFYTVGRNIRVKAQIKPGLIDVSREVAA
jgi:hypothetical protein